MTLSGWHDVVMLLVRLSFGLSSGCMALAESPHIVKSCFAVVADVEKAGDRASWYQPCPTKLGTRRDA